MCQILNVRELDPPTNPCINLKQTGGRFYMWVSDPFPENFVIVLHSATIQSQNKLKTTWEIEVQQKSKVHVAS